MARRYVRMLVTSMLLYYTILYYRPEDTVEQTMQVCYAWAECRRVLQDSIGDGDLSRLALVEPIVRGDTKAWKAVTFFCEAVMQVKEGTEHERELRASDSRPRRSRIIRLVCRTSRDDLQPLSA